jgi:hypothetical protein
MPAQVHEHNYQLARIEAPPAADEFESPDSTGSKPTEQRRSIMFPIKIIFRMLLLIAGLVLLIGGCASTVGHHKVEDLHNIPLGTVPARIYEASGEEVKQAALYSLKTSGLENIQEHQMGNADWYITGEVGYSWRSNGQFVRIAASVDRNSNPLRTKVFYTSLRRFEINVTEDLSVIQNKLLNLMDNFIESQ